MNVKNINRLFLLDKPICLSFRQRACLFCISFIFVIVYIVIYFVYRPYIYANNIWDMHIADSCSSFITMLAGVCFLYMVEKKQLLTPLGIVLLSEFTFILYEVVFSYTFDYYDVLSTLLGGYPAYLLLGFVLKKMKVCE